MDLLQTAAAMEKTGDSAWIYIGKMLVFYAAISASSNYTFTPDDVRRDLDGLQTITPEVEEGYVGAIADLTFDKKTFPEVVAAVVMNRLMLAVHIIIGFSASVTLGIHGRDWWEKSRNWKKVMNSLRDGHGINDDIGLATRLNFLSREIAKKSEAYEWLEPLSHAKDIIPPKPHFIPEKVMHTLRDYYIKQDFDIKSTQSGWYNVVLDDDFELNELLRRIQDDIKQKEFLRETFTDYHKVIEIPPQFFKRSTEGLAFGVAMASFALGMSAVNWVQMIDTVAVLKNYTMLYAANDVHTMAAALDTLKAWHV